MQTGIMLTTPGGVKFWHKCRDAATGLREMEQAAFVYGPAWTHPETAVEFGTSDGAAFTRSELLRGPKEA